ncbi:MAG TPA: FAD-linked oxidase C-terminal domain-containing protein [Kiritimatiellia bacterium]|nr:FAD-linked oxidase C-terminal domain-containing protein [Kiritimatiellia bacterium]
MMKSNPSRLSPTALEAFSSLLGNRARHDEATLAAYSSDASMYQFKPLLVIEPASCQEILDAMAICRQFELPILPRGGGTSLVGQSIGKAVVFDVSRHFNRIIELDKKSRWIRVEPGITRDALNLYLQPYGLQFAPDPATSSRANIGGMIASNAAGMRSIRYGMTIDHILEITVALTDGTILQLGKSSEPSDLTSNVIVGLQKILEREQDEIINRFPKVRRRSGGYSLDAFVGPKPWNMAKIIAGSEGTLGFILDAKLSLEPLPRYSSLCLAHFQDLMECLRAVSTVNSFNPSAVELLDGVIINQARQHVLTRDTCHMINGEPEGLLVIEFQSDSIEDNRESAVALKTALETRTACYAFSIIDNESSIRDVWLMRESALGLITTVQGNRKPTPYIEDASVPPDNLPDYVSDVLAVCRQHGQPVSLFAHAGVGLLHIRPLHDLHSRADIDQMLKIQNEVFELVRKYKGSWSGEHGDGIIRGSFNREFFGERIYQVFREIKTLFDPDGLMNPGRILDTPPRDESLRFGAYQKPESLTPAFQWSENGGLLSAVEQCTGIGACRKIGAGVMCPSYMALRDEVHGTRGRANVLRLALTGQLGPNALVGDDVMNAFDLCLSCKGCRSECPNKVDVGKMKTELVHNYYKHHRRSIRSSLFSRTNLLGRLFSGAIAPIVNTLLHSHILRQLLDSLLKIDARRKLPDYADETFSQWFHSRTDQQKEAVIPVVLFNDYVTEYHEPELGKSAVRILEACGMNVQLISNCDSQRPALSQAMLDRAREFGAQLFDRLAKSGGNNDPILVIEPSSLSALIQDLPDLIHNEQAVKSVLPRLMLLDDFLAMRINADTFKTPSAPVFVFNHCHQRSMDGGRSTIKLLQQIKGLDMRTSRAGCCGMAGSFGYEKEHYELSVKIARDRLLPEINDLDEHAIILANGFSCRQQIRDLTGRQALHPVQYLDTLMH